MDVLNCIVYYRVFLSGRCSWWAEPPRRALQVSSRYHIQTGRFKQSGSLLRVLPSVSSTRSDLANGALFGLQMGFCIAEIGMWLGTVEVGILTHFILQNNLGESWFLLLSSCSRNRFFTNMSSLQLSGMCMPKISHRTREITCEAFPVAPARHSELCFYCMWVSDTCPKRFAIYLSHLVYCKDC